MIVRMFISLCFLICFPICPLLGNDCYTEYWQQFFWKMWARDPFKIKTYVRIQTGNHFRNIRYLEINEQFIWNAAENYSFELHYTYIHERSIVPHSPWRWQHRLEFEANRTFHLPRDYLIQTRNRLEIVREQKEPKTQFRLRQRTMLVIPFECKGRLKSFSFHNELFYNATTHLITQDRICPLQFTFMISDKIDLDLFFLVRFFRVGNIWQRSAVLGTQFNF